MPADNLPLCCYFDIDVPEILPFQLYLVNELDFIRQETFAVFDFSDEMQEYLVSQTIQQESDFTQSTLSNLSLNDFTTQFSAEKTLLTKQDLIDFVFERDLQLNIFSVIKLNEFLVELTKQSSFVIKKEKETFLWQLDDSDEISN